jgi:hypothetical protein
MKMETMIRRTSKQLLFTFVAALLLPISLVGADNRPAHRIDQNFPISLGTSGGNINDRTKAFCYGGTLGALVQNAANGTQYILSNNHVLARTNAAKLGEDIIQPGLIDQSPVCAQDSTDAVADLSDFISIKFKGKGTIPSNTVDAAIAQVRPNRVDSTGRIIDMGAISDATVQPVIGLAVKKSGRTTGLTTGSISAVDVTVDVSYGSGKTARFVNQILVTPGTFIDSGDSGSLMVEDLDPTPRAVGLLFAGSSSVAIANPIDDVLSAFGVTMVGVSTMSLTRKILDWAKNLFSVSESHAASAQLPSSVNPAAVDAVRKAKIRHEAQLMSVPGVVGVGIGQSEKLPGQAAIEVYVKEPATAMRSQLPNSLDGIEVKIIETGEIHAY